MPIAVAGCADPGNRDSGRGGDVALWPRFAGRRRLRRQIEGEFVGKGGAGLEARDRVGRTLNRPIDG